MAAVGSYVHMPTHTLNTLCSDTYAVARRHNAWLFQNEGTINPALTTASPIRSRLGALYMSVDTIAAGCNAITIRVCSDLAGDVPILGDTTATISTGVTTATAGGVTFKFDVPWSNTDSNFYVFWKCNVGGTCQVRSIKVSWYE